MNENKPNIKIAIVAFLFLLGIPIITVLFSHFGLERFKQIKGELFFLKDSININRINGLSSNGYLLNEKIIKDKALLVHFVEDLQNQSQNQKMNQALVKLQESLPVEKPYKWLIISYVKEEENPEKLTNLTQNITRDTNTWKIISLPEQAWNQLITQYHLPKDSISSFINLVDQNSYLCSRYNPDNKELFDKLPQHLAIAIPKQERRSIEYKADKDLYK